MRNNGCLKVVDRVNGNQDKGYMELTGATIDIHLVLKDFPFAFNIEQCLNRKEYFGLANDKGSVVVFDTSELKVFYLSDTLKQLNIIDCGDFKSFVDNIKLTIVDHRMYLPAQLCVNHFKTKGLIK